MSTKRATVQSIRGYFMENYNEEFPEEAPFVEAFKSWPEDQNPLQGTGIDSLDVLDIIFAIDKEYRVKLPLEKWSMALSQGKTRDPDGNEWMSFASIASEVNRLLDEQAAATDTSYTAALSH